MFAACNRKSRKSVVQFEQNAAEKQNLIYSLDHTEATWRIFVQCFEQGRSALATREVGSAPEEPVQPALLPPRKSQCYITDHCNAAHICSHMHTYKLKCFSNLSSQHQQLSSRLILECSPKGILLHTPAALFQQSCTGSQKVTLEEETQLFLQAPLSAFFWGGERHIAMRGSNLPFSMSIHFPWDCVPCKDFILVAP